MKKIAIFTSARSDYGPLRRVIELCSSAFDLDLLVADLHYTAPQTAASEIRNHIENFAVREVPINLKLADTSHRARTEAIAQGQSSMARWLEQQHYDCLVILGDRWELFAASIPALMFQIPIAHISGGEVTEGALDDSIRHAHSKMASLHFVANTGYANNLSRMGEEDWRITVSGECGLDSIHHHHFASFDELLEQRKVDLAQQFMLVTYHPATNDLTTTVDAQVDGLLKALGHFPAYNIIFTAPGNEQGADLIVQKIIQYSQTHRHVQFIANFGSRHYLTVLRNAKVVIGNSSSGLVEAASFGVPCVNVGQRQSGRMAAQSVLNTDYSEQDIIAQINKALTPAFQKFSQECVNPYDPYRDGRNSERIVFALQNALNTLSPQQLIQKKLNFEVQNHQWNTLLEGLK